MCRRADRKSARLLLDLRSQLKVVSCQLSVVSCQLSVVSCHQEEGRRKKEEGRGKKEDVLQGESLFCICSAVPARLLIKQYG